MSLQVLAEGAAPYKAPDFAAHRAWMRDRKPRGLVSKIMDEHEAVARFVDDGDYLAYDCNMFMRGPASLLREIVRQRKRRLWLCGKFTYVDVAFLVAAGVADRVDVGFVGVGQLLTNAIAHGRLQTYEYSNVTLTLRLQAGAMGVPFLPARFFGGTTGFQHSGAKLVTDPFSGDPVVLLPALHPDVGIIHVHQADVYGNARVFGTGIAHVETALASRKVILSAEEIIETEEIRRNPGLTSIPYSVVDAVVHAPFGAFPGTCAGRYGSDSEQVMQLWMGIAMDRLQPYLDEWVYGVASHEDLLEKLGARRLLALQARERIREGYVP